MFLYKTKVSNDVNKKSSNDLHDLRHKMC